MISVTSLKSSAQSSTLDSLFSDTLNIKETKKHSPNKATLFSTVLPGLGQAYNKKYWKVPIVYAAIGLPLYFAISNQRNFNKFKTAYGLRIDGDPNTIDEFEGVLSEAGIKSNLDFHQRNKDLSYILVGLFYVFNIVDAAVDAHLFNFPKNDNLSFNLQPSIELTSNNKLSKGFKLVINL
ncbi:MAG: hypothetical protein HRT73_02105 [Flavobacteriales bacterium]|nr:hypothetical protein [Flavobacteriales bacterium]NQX96658.1 hypothetical protein [Flavobacteriales bacterium]